MHKKWKSREFKGVKGNKGKGKEKKTENEGKGRKGTEKEGGKKVCSQSSEYERFLWVSRGEKEGRRGVKKVLYLEASIDSRMEGERKSKIHPKSLYVRKMEEGKKD